MSPEEDPNVVNSTIDEILASMNEDEDHQVERIDSDDLNDVLADEHLRKNPPKAQGPKPFDKEEADDDDEPQDSGESAPGVSLDTASIEDILQDAHETESVPADDATLEETEAPAELIRGKEAEEPEIEPEDLAKLDSILMDYDEQEPTSEPDQPQPTMQPTVQQPSVAAAPAAPASGSGKLIWLLVGLLILNVACLAFLSVGLFVVVSDGGERVDKLISVLDRGLGAGQPVAEREADVLLAQAERAENLYQTAQYEKALPLLGKVAKVMPNRPDLQWKKAMSAWQLKDWQNAVEYFKQYAENNPASPQTPEAVLKMGYAYKNLGLYEEARKAFYQYIGLSGRLDAPQQKQLPAVYEQIADCHRLQAEAIRTAEGASVTARAN